MMLTIRGSSISISLSLLFARELAAAILPMNADSALAMPMPGDYGLRIVAPAILELVLINTKRPDPARVDSWDFVGTNYQLAAISQQEFEVTVDNQPVSVAAVGFKRRPLYAPLAERDLRIGSCLYLQLNRALSPIGDPQTVEVKNPSGKLWPTNFQFIASTQPLRYGPAIHVNQVGYVPSFP